MPVNPSVPDVLLDGPFRIRRLRDTDLKTLHSVFSNPGAVRYWMLPPARTIEDTRTWIAKSLATPTAYHAAWVMEEPSTRELFGLVSYHDREPWQDRAKIDCIALEHAYNAGIVASAIRELTAYCFSGLRSNRIECLADPRDPVLPGVLESCGFSQDGLLRQRIRVDNEFRDCILFSLLGADWSRTTGRKIDGRDSSALLWRLPKNDPGTNIAAWEQQQKASTGWVDASVPVGFVVPTHLKGNTLELVDAQRTHIIRAPAPVLKAIIQAGNGFHTVDEIVECVPVRYAREDVRALVTSLVEQGLLVPSDRRVESQWMWLRNPPLYRAALNPERAAELTREASALADKPAVGTTVVESGTSDLAQLLQRRETSRTFSGKPIALKTLATILYCSYGVLDERKEWRNTTLARRTIPSAGGIYPLDFTWVQLLDTSELPAAVYKLSFHHGRRVAFTKLDADHRAIYRGIVDPVTIADAHGILLLGAHFERPRSKYGNRAVLLAMIEAGHAAQNLSLAATELGIGVLELGGFFDGFVKELTGRRDCEPLLSLALGSTPANDDRATEKTVAQITFDWVDHRSPHTLPFHLARARIEAGKKGTDWCWGRSPDPELAMTKAVAESIERLACQWPQDIVWERAAELDNFIPPQKFVRYPAESYKRKGFPLTKFNDGNQYPWVKVENVKTGRSVNVLADLVFFNNAFGDDYKTFYTSSSTSGTAAYPEIDGAIERALFELIERHCFMYSWLRGIVCPKIRYDSLPGSMGVRLKALAELGWDIDVLATATEPVATFMVAARNRKRHMVRLASCAAFDPEAAVAHALTEVESAIPSTYDPHLNLGGVVDLAGIKSPQDHGDLYLNRRYDHKADWMLANNRLLDLKEIKSSKKSTTQIIDYLCASGLDIYVRDITPPVTIPVQKFNKIKVVRLLVEGLVPISFGYRMEPAIPELTLNILNDNTLGKNFEIAGKRQYFPHPFF